MPPTPRPHTHIEIWHLDGTILDSSDKNAAPFPLQVGEQLLAPGPYTVREVTDSEPREENGVIYYRRIVRVS
jgi:hypothetical protein